MGGPPTRYGQPDNERLGLYVIAVVVVLVLLIAMAFSYIGNIAGVLTIAVTGVVGLWALFVWDRRGPVEVAAAPEDGVRRTLLFVDAKVEAPKLADKLARAGTDREVLVVVPARTDLIHRAASDIDAAQAAAADELSSIRRELAPRFEHLDGFVGDADETAALEDALRVYPADELVLVSAAPEKRAGLQRLVAARARRDVPLRLLELTPD